MTRFLKVIASLVLLVCALAQSFTASVRRVVADSTKSAVPNAKVVITDADRNTNQETATDVAGRYVFTALPPGRYSLAVEAAGFSKYTFSAFPLQIQQQATIDVELNVGALSTAITVESSAPLL